jgi:recombination DNA repair RAD52 pathway protein
VEQTPGGKFSAGYSAVVCVSLKDGSFHEDIGYGQSDNQKAKGVALANAKKNAVSDALKRSLRNFGNQLGLTIYDREHIKVLKKNSRLKSNEPKVKALNPHYDKSVSPIMKMEPPPEPSTSVKIIPTNNGNGIPVSRIPVSSPNLIPTTVRQSPVIIKNEPEVETPLIPVSIPSPKSSSTPIIPIGKRPPLNQNNSFDAKKRKVE